MRTAIRSSLGALAIACLPACAGCDSDRVATYPVSGSVKFEDGLPVSHGAVEFREEETRLSARAKLDTNGEFALGTFTADDGAPAGNYRVIVIQHFDVPPRANHPQARGEQIDHEHDPGTDIRVSPEFANFSASGLQATVRPGSDNRFEFVVRRLRPNVLP